MNLKPRYGLTIGLLGLFCLMQLAPSAHADTFTVKGAGSVAKAAGVYVIPGQGTIARNLTGDVGSNGSVDTPAPKPNAGQEMLVVRTPEPSTLLLLGIGLLCLCWAAWRKRSSKPEDLAA